mgnify:CR=1 FL=1
MGGLELDRELCLGTLSGVHADQVVKTNCTIPTNCQEGVSGGGQMNGYLQVS